MQGGWGVKKWQNSVHVVVECPLKKYNLSHVARIVLFSTNRWRFDGEISKWRFWCKYVYCSVINNISWYCNKNFKNATEFTLCFVLLFITIDDFLIDSPHVFTNFSHWYFSISWDIYVKFWSFSHVQSWKEKAFSPTRFFFYFNWEILVEKLVKKMVRTFFSLFTVSH